MIGKQKAQTKMVRTHNKRREACQNSALGNGQRRKKKRKTEGEMGRQQQQSMDRIEAERGDQTCGGQGRLERTS